MALSTSFEYSRSPLKAISILIQEEAPMNTITNHYIDGAFVESHGCEVMDIVNPTNGKVIAKVTLADEEDARRAIAAAKRAFASFGRTTKEERIDILRRLHKAGLGGPERVTQKNV